MTGSHPATVLYDYAMRIAGLPYRYGGDDLIEGLDCSGLVVELLLAAGVVSKGFDSNAHGLWHFPAFTKAAAPQFGTLCFFGSEAFVSHVGFCLNETQMLEAGGGTSQTTTKEAAVKQNAFVRVRLIKSRKDLVGYRHPPYPWKVA